MPRSRRAARSNGAKAAANTKAVARAHAVADTSRPANGPDWFTWFAQTTAHLAGKPSTFLIALALIVIWATSGPLFGFSDTWQLVVNTATTIVTFLMVFLIQSTQNRDTLALQVKLADLIIAIRGAHNSMATAEDMTEAELETLHQEYRKRAEQTGASLQKRRTASAGH